MINPTSDQIDAVFTALRHFIDDAGYKRYIDDDWVNRASTAASIACVNAAPAAVAEAPKTTTYRKGIKR